MTKRIIGAILVGFMAVTASVSLAVAQGTDEDKIVAVANGAPVYMSEILQAATGLPEQYRDAPMDALYPHLLDRVIAMKLLVAEGERLELGQTEEFELQMEYVREQLLEQAVLNRAVDEAITDEALQERYQTFLKTQPGGEEIHARHILLADEMAANEVIGMLEGGADFAEVAKTHSTGPSGPQGGDLGYFTKGQMVPAFEQAVFALEKSAFTTSPVQTQFGWHVILLEDRRAIPAPTLADVETQLRGEMAREIEVEYVKSMTAKATVERFNMNGTPMENSAQ
jgi:peptidyl-prolyl cis-trans isomerase C